MGSVRIPRLIALLLISALAAVLANPIPASAADPIQPGDLMQAGSAQCTLNFVYDGAGRLAGNVYMGTAAHCVDNVGQSVSDGDGRTWGRVAFIANPNDIGNDFAFIQVISSFKSSVRSSVLGHEGTPKGVASANEGGAGDVVLLSGYGLIFRPTALTRHKRFGVLLTTTGSEYQAVAPHFFGDSGGPVVLGGSGAALGIVSVVCLGTCGNLRGPTVQHILKKSASSGFPVRLRSAH